MGKITDFPAAFQSQLQGLMQSMKNNFAEQLKKLQDDFVNKQMGEIIKVYKTLEENQKRIQEFHKSKTNALGRVREELLKEKQTWETAKK
jgi:predicted Holliday junction resolvase-like endonuclease